MARPVASAIRAYRDRDRLLLPAARRDHRARARAGDAPERARPRGDGRHRQPLPAAVGRRCRSRPVAHAPFEIIRMGQALRLYGNASQTLHTLDFRMISEDEEALSRAPLRRHPRRTRRTTRLRHAGRPFAAPVVGDHRAGRSTPSSRPGRCSTCSAARCARRSGAWTARSWCPRPASARSSPYFPYDYTVIPNGIDERHFTPDADPIEQLRDGRMNILFLGRFDPRNGLGTMIDAFIRVRREWGPEVRLVVVGDGPLRSFYQKRVPDEHAADVALGRPRRLGAAAVLHQCRCPLHAVQSGLVRHGAARGDELRAARSSRAASPASSS